MILFISLISCITFLFATCETNKLSFFDSIYFSSITFFTVGYGDITLTNVAGRLLSIVTGGSGVLFMGMFVSSFYSSIQNYSEYKERIPHDKNVLRVLSEVRQDYLNILGNYHLTNGDVLLVWTPDSLKKESDNIFKSLTRTNTPDLSGEYHAFGKDAFLSSAEIVDRKIQNLLLIDFDSNFKSEIKSIALLSRNLTNHFHWSFFKNTDMKNQERSFIDSIFIVGEENRPSIIMQYLELERELGLLISKLVQETNISKDYK